ncbi:hypothetical protein DU508_09070 [Pedobacter chinensis]|uniref:Bacteriocin n=1 Tax=Pedobacter chinensis TaxID=2282421 RepID=A0A369PX96_9SPHI|nr:hypothetical protein [Pedobacter chinensis]RDC57311.1 hypothetical protein DU508_09070 [Pedobacter chinensis]
MKKLELENFGVQEMDAKEMVVIDGGNLPPWAKGGIWGAIAYEIMDNWKAVKAGLSDGWNGTYNNKY